MGDTRALIRDVLASHYILKDFMPADLDRLAELATVTSFPAGRTLFSKGDPGTSMMAVLKGRVRISCFAADGREMVLAVFGPGQVFGEIAMIDGGERTADAVTLEPTDLLILNRRDFLPILERNPKVCVNLLLMMCDRLRSTDEQLEDYNFRNLRSRLAKRLLVASDYHGRRKSGEMHDAIRLPQHVLASIVGTTREAVNKQLRSWEDAGLIDVRRGSITLLEPQELARIVEEEA